MVTSPPETTAEDRKLAFEIYKLEYEKGAERYQDIYKSVWTNFNYLVLLAGGILAFSSNSKALPQYLTIILACLPLLYWYVAVFTPGNRYGDQVMGRLSRVEQIINELYAGDIETDLCLSPPSSPPAKSDCGLQHFTLFHSRRSEPGWVTQLARWIESGIGDVRLFPPSVRATTLLAALGILGLVVWSWWSKPQWPGAKNSVTIEQSQKQLDVRVMNADIEEIKNLLQNGVQTREDLRRLEASLQKLSEQLNAMNQSLHRGQQP